MVVKFADTQKDKDVRTKVISTNNNIIGAHYPNGIGIPANMTHQYLTVSQQIYISKLFVCIQFFYKIQWIFYVPK